MLGSFEEINAKINRLKREGGVGWEESGKTYTFDGILEGKDYVPYTSGNGFLKVSSDTPDLHKFEEVETIIGVITPTEPAVSIIEGTAENNELFGARGYALLHGATPLIVVITDTLNSPVPSTGLYFLCSGYPENIETAANELVIAETIHPISDKYLPGVCLPVVELTTEPGINGYATLTTDECSALNAAFEKKMPVVCKFGLMGMTVSIPLMYIVNPADSSGYLGTSPFGDLHLTVGNVGNWTAMYRPKG